MRTYITFLRGVNITGHNPIKMNDLTGLFRNLGYDDAETYIQSGNVIFSSSELLSGGDISRRIEEAITDKWGYIVPVMVRTAEELEQFTETNPFLSELNFDPAKMAIIFLHEAPDNEQIKKVSSVNYPPDKFMISGREIFIYCPNGFGKTKLYTNFFENKMKVVGTARNWKTIKTILGLALSR